METPVLTQIQNYSDNLLPALKRRKTELKLTNTDIAERTGISLDTVRKYFAGESKSPNVFNIMSMCIMMGLSLDNLLGNPHEREVITEKVDHDNCKRVRELESVVHDLKTELHFSKQADEMKNSTIKRLDILLVSVCVISVIFLLSYIFTDFSYPEIGFYKKGTASPFMILSILLILCCIVTAGVFAHRFRKRVKRDKENEL